MLTPLIGSVTADQIAHWGVPLAFAAVGFWLFWLTREKRNAPSDNLPTTTAEISPIHDQMPILAFVELACNRGWHVSGQHDLEAMDLTNGLAEAGSNQVIEFWGRRRPERQRIPIEREHWRDHEFDVISLLNALENVETRTQRFAADQNRWVSGFTDIHIGAAAATRWLASPQALAFRGQTLRGERERERRRLSS